MILIILDFYESFPCRTGYAVLDELMRSPRPLRFIFHLLSVTQPEEYEAESWQLTVEQKLESVETLRLEGNRLFSQVCRLMVTL